MTDHTLAKWIARDAETYGSDNGPICHQCRTSTIYTYAVNAQTRQMYATCAGCRWISAIPFTGAVPETAAACSTYHREPATQPALPGAENVRDQEIATPAYDAPFSLTPAASDRRAKQKGLF